jgi:hypothetical protein
MERPGKPFFDQDRANVPTVHLERAARPAVIAHQRSLGPRLARARHLLKVKSVTGNKLAQARGRRSA